MINHSLLEELVLYVCIYLHIRKSSYYNNT